MATAVPSRPLRVTQMRGSVQRGGTKSVFVAVPEGVQNLELALTGVDTDDQVRFLAIDPYGVPVDEQASSRCYTHYSDAAACAPTARSYDQPAAGIWEFEVEARRTSPSLDNPYRLTARLQGVKVTPGTVTIETASVHRPVDGTFTATNTWGRATVTPVEGQVGRTRDLWSEVAEGQMTQGQVDVARDATRLEVTITPRQSDADLDVYLFGRDGLVAQSTTMGPGAEHIVVRNPQPGTHAIVVAAVDVPSGTTEFDYHEQAFSRGIGSISVPSGAGKRAGARPEAHGQGDGHAVRDAGQRPTPRGPGPVRQPARVGDRLRRGADQGGHHARRGGARIVGGDGRLRPEQRRRDDRRQADRLAHQAGPLDRGRRGRGARAR